VAVAQRELGFLQAQREQLEVQARFPRPLSTSRQVAEVRVVVETQPQVQTALVEMEPTVRRVLVLVHTAVELQETSPVEQEPTQVETLSLHQARVVVVVVVRVQEQPRPRVQRQSVGLVVRQQAHTAVGYSPLAAHQVRLVTPMVKTSSAVNTFAVVEVEVDSPSRPTQVERGVSERAVLVEDSAVIPQMVL
jgi:hypothetical protein